MKKTVYACLVMLTALLSGCGTVTHNAVYKPQVTQLNIGLHDMEYLGETEIEVTYNTYLGFIRNTQTVNGEVYSSAAAKYTRIDDRSLRLGKLEKASYKVLEKFPKATYFQVVRTTKNVDRLFLGNQVKETAIVRAYRFK